MALNAATQWEVRSTGSDANAGGFKAGATGTDYSQQDSPQGTWTGSVHTTTTQVNVTGYTVAAGDVGNHIRISAGTATAGVYEITAVDTANNRWTLDRAAGASAATITTATMGGALLTVAAAFTVAVAENTVWLKAGTYTITAGLTGFGAAVSLPTTAPQMFLGYNVTRGDNPTGSSRPVISTSSAIVMLTVAGVNFLIGNIQFDGGDTATTGITFTNGNPRGMTLCNVKVSRCTTRGVNMDGATAIKCEFTAMATGASDAVACYSGTLVDCVAHTNPCSGFNLNGNTGGTLFLRCIAYNNTGAASDGFTLEDALSHTLVMNCVSYGNGRDGYRSANSYNCANIMNSIAYGNVGYGIRFNTGARRIAQPDLDFNAFGSNTAGPRFGCVAGPNDITLTGDPFVAATSGNFALDSTTGEGAALRATGFPGTLNYGGTGYTDIGALQHQDSGGSTNIFTARPSAHLRR